MKKNSHKIQDIINKVLRNRFATDLIYCLPLFHISKGHQVNLKPYNNFLNLNKKNYNNDFFKKIKFFVTYLFSENKIFYPKKINHTNFDVFLISNIISDKSLKEDYIFGNLADDLNKINIKTLSIFKNFSNIPSKKINNKLRRPSVVLAKTVSVLKEISFLKNIYFVKKALNLLKKKIKNKQINIFLNYINQLKYILPIVSNIRLYYQINALIKQYRPHTIIFTFENHAWEKFLINKIKHDFKTINKIAYQFTTITKDQFLKYSKNEFNPDYILSSGSKPYKYLKGIYKNKVKVLNFGSYRKQILLKKKSFYNKSFLLLPESPESETNDFIFMAINLAKNYKNCKFTLRLHPMSKSIEIINRINLQSVNLRNFFISNNSLEEDLNNNFFTIYRSSSLCITAALNGLLPIYLSDNNFNLDPLHIINKKYKLHSVDDLKKILSYSKTQNIRYQKKVGKFCSYYFEKPNYRKNFKLFNNLNQTVI